MSAPLKFSFKKLASVDQLLRAAEVSDDEEGDSQIVSEEDEEDDEEVNYYLRRAEVPEDTARTPEVPKPRVVETGSNPPRFPPPAGQEGGVEKKVVDPPIPAPPSPDSSKTEPPEGRVFKLKVGGMKDAGDMPGKTPSKDRDLVPKYKRADAKLSAERDYTKSPSVSQKEETIHDDPYDRPSVPAPTVRAAPNKAVARPTVKSILKAMDDVDNTFMQTYIKPPPVVEDEDEGMVVDAPTNTAKVKTKLELLAGLDDKELLTLASLNNLGGFESHNRSKMNRRMKDFKSKYKMMMDVASKGKASISEIGKSIGYQAKEDDILRSYVRSFVDKAKFLGLSVPVDVLKQLSEEQVSNLTVQVTYKFNQYSRQNQMLNALWTKAANNRKVVYGDQEVLLSEVHSMVDARQIYMTTGRKLNYLSPLRLEYLYRRFFLVGPEPVENRRDILCFCVMNLLWAFLPVKMRVARQLEEKYMPLLKSYALLRYFYKLNETEGLNEEQEQAMTSEANKYSKLLKAIGLDLGNTVLTPEKLDHNLFLRQIHADIVKTLVREPFNDKPVMKLGNELRGIHYVSTRGCLPADNAFLEYAMDYDQANEARMNVLAVAQAWYMGNGDSLGLFRRKNEVYDVHYRILRSQIYESPDKPHVVLKNFLVNHAKFLNSYLGSIIQIGLIKDDVIDAVGLLTRELPDGSEMILPPSLWRFCWDYENSELDMDQLVSVRDSSYEDGGEGYTSVPIVMYNPMKKRAGAGFPFDGLAKKGDVLRQADELRDELWKVRRNYLSGHKYQQLTVSDPLFNNLCFTQARSKVEPYELPRPHSANEGAFLYGNLTTDKVRTIYAVGMIASMDVCQILSMIFKKIPSCFVPVKNLAGETYYPRINGQRYFHLWNTSKFHGNTQVLMDWILRTGCFKSETRGVRGFTYSDNIYVSAVIDRPSTTPGWDYPVGSEVFLSIDGSKFESASLKEMIHQNFDQLLIATGIKENFPDVYGFLCMCAWHSLTDGFFVNEWGKFYEPFNCSGNILTFFNNDVRSMYILSEIIKVSDQKGFCMDDVIPIGEACGGIIKIEKIVDFTGGVKDYVIYDIDFLGFAVQRHPVVAGSNLSATAHEDEEGGYLWLPILQEERLLKSIAFSKKPDNVLERKARESGNRFTRDNIRRAITSSKYISLLLSGACLLDMYSPPLVHYIVSTPNLRSVLSQIELDTDEQDALDDLEPVDMDYIYEKNALYQGLPATEDYKAARLEIVNDVTKFFYVKYFRMNVTTDPVASSSVALDTEGVSNVLVRLADAKSEFSANMFRDALRMAVMNDVTLRNEKIMVELVYMKDKDGKKWRYRLVPRDKERILNLGREIGLPRPERMIGAAYELMSMDRSFFTGFEEQKSNNKDRQMLFRQLPVISVKRTNKSKMSVDYSRGLEIRLNGSVPHVLAENQDIDSYQKCLTVLKERLKEPPATFVQFERECKNMFNMTKLSSAEAHLGAILEICCLFHVISRATYHDSYSIGQFSSYREAARTVYKVILLDTEEDKLTPFEVVLRLSLLVNYLYAGQPSHGNVPSLPVPPGLSLGRLSPESLTLESPLSINNLNNLQAFPLRIKDKSHLFFPMYVHNLKESRFDFPALKEDNAGGYGVVKQAVFVYTMAQHCQIRLHNLSRLRYYWKDTLRETFCSACSTNILDLLVDFEVPHEPRQPGQPPDIFAPIMQAYG